MVRAPQHVKRNGLEIGHKSRHLIIYLILIETPDL